MNIKYQLTKKPTLFSKGTHVAQISDVSLADANELFQTLLHLRLFESGKENESWVTISTQEFSGEELWQNQSDCEHFLSGFELAMMLNGVKMDGKFWTHFDSSRQARKSN